MDKICKVYVSQVKAILPVWGKKEKAFVKKLHSDLCDYCEDNNVNTIDELYKGYGTPQEIAFEYISLMEPQVISKRINSAKFIRILVIGLLAFVTIATSVLCAYLYSQYQLSAHEEVAICNETITEYD